MDHPDPLSLPPLPPPVDDDQSAVLLDDSQPDVLDSTTLAEQAVLAQLQDVESSFDFAPTSPLFTVTRSATVPPDDDLKIFAAFPPSKPPLPSHSAALSAATLSTTAVPSSDQQAAGPPSDFNFLSSSPTTVATTRAQFRASVAVQSNHGQDHVPNDATEIISAATSGSSLAVLPITGRDPAAHLFSAPALSDAQQGRSPVSSLGRRPRHPRSRWSSQQSSASSFVTNPDPHDDNDSVITVDGLATDYALQSGGAVPQPALAHSLGHSQFLSRSISVGSIISGIESLYERPFLEDLSEIDGWTGSPHHFHAPPYSSSHTPRPTVESTPSVLSTAPSTIAHASTAESDTPRAGNSNRSVGGAENGDDLMFNTPRPPRQSLAPTDTVLAQHVRKIRVPDSLAREYRLKKNLSAPRPTKNLTLREQSSAIERLSKENFDLKLKVMFLSDRLDKESSIEGVKEAIAENVLLKTTLTGLQRDNKNLRRRIKELEKVVREEQNGSLAARSSTASTDDVAPASHYDEEWMHLHARLEQYAVETEQLRVDCLHKEAERRRMAGVVKSLTDNKFGGNDETAMWRDLIDQESARCEAANEDIKRLKDENFRLKQQLSGVAASGRESAVALYRPLSKRARTGSLARSGTSSDGHGGYGGHSAHGGHGGHDGNDGNDGHDCRDGRDGSTDGASGPTSTLVTGLRTELGEVQHELEQLRREYSARMSLLTSRTKEKNQVVQELEELKLAVRANTAPRSTVDSILERSVSRAGMGGESAAMAAGERSQSPSRESGLTRLTQLTSTDVEAEYAEEREQMENKVAELRDKANQTKLMNQELQQQLDGYKQHCEQLSTEVAVLQNELQYAEDCQDEIAGHRDDLLHENEYLVSELDQADTSSRQSSEKVEQLKVRLMEKSEDLTALQEEMQQIGKTILGLEHEQQAKSRRNRELEQECELLEGKLREVNGQAGRLAVQQESHQRQIAFLEEEQQVDKQRISGLEAGLARAQDASGRLSERAHELEVALSAERAQKQEAQRLFEQLKAELSQRGIEATLWKERLMELESNLREALGDLNGTRSSILNSITKLQGELEQTVKELNMTKTSSMEKDRTIKQRDGALESLGLEYRKMSDQLEKERQAVKHRDGLLESHGIELRKLADLLDKERQAVTKERQAHYNTKAQFDSFQRQHQPAIQAASTFESQKARLESQKTNEANKFVILEMAFKKQLEERNGLLLALWVQLSAICGTDWAHAHQLVDGRAVPSMGVIGTQLPGFSKNLLAAVETVGGMLKGLQGRIESIEVDLWREYQALESSLDSKSRKLEHLEAAALRSDEEQARNIRLHEAYRQLKVENATLKAANDARARAYAATTAGSTTSGMGDMTSGLFPGSPSPSVPTGPRDRERNTRRSRDTALSAANAAVAAHAPPPAISRPASGAGAVPASALTSASVSTTGAGTLVIAGGGPPSPTKLSSSSDQLPETCGGEMSASNKKWILRLRDLEGKVQLERDRRLEERQSARQRLATLESEATEHRDEVARLKLALEAKRMSEVR